MSKNYSLRLGTRKSVMGMYVIATLLILPVLLPIIHVVIASFYHPLFGGKIVSTSVLSIENYIILFTEKDGMRALNNSILNSLLSASVAVFLALGLCALLLYMRARPSIVVIGLIAMNSIPPITLLLSQREILNWLGIEESREVLLVFQGLSFFPVVTLIIAIRFWSLFADRNFMLSSIRRLVHVDGLSFADILFKVAIPSSKPELLIAYLIGFAMSWGDLLYSNIFTTFQAEEPLTVLYLRLEGGQRMDWGSLYAGISLTIVIISLLLLLIGKALRKIENAENYI
ncbi:MAG: hypothetical protein AB2689_05345 [Candidatus Thiodiazotropha taylori]